MNLDTQLARARTYASHHIERPDANTWSWDFSDEVFIALKAYEKAGMAPAITYPGEGRLAHYRGIPIVIARNKGWALYTGTGQVVTQETMGALTPAAASKQDGMVELPRNPLHFVIDDLSPSALNTLETWPYADNRPAQQTYTRIGPWLKELLDKSLVEGVSTKKNGSGNVVQWTIKPTLPGWEAIEHLRCGLYAHHRTLYLARAKRDTEEETIPGWGQF